MEGITRQKQRGGSGTALQVKEENGKYNASLVLAHKLARYFSCIIEDIFLFDEEE